MKCDEDRKFNEHYDEVKPFTRFKEGDTVQFVSNNTETYRGRRGKVLSMYLQEHSKSGVMVHVEGMPEMDSSYFEKVKG